MELGDKSDNEERAIPDIIISRSSIPDAERARNIRMVPMLQDHEEESETDSSKESSASDDVGDNGEDFRQETRPHRSDKSVTPGLEMNQDESSTKTSQSGTDVQDAVPLSSTKEDAMSNVFPTPNVEEYFSEYEDATDDEQVLVGDQAQQFKADTKAVQHLDSSTTNEPDKICKSCYHKYTIVVLIR